MRRSLLLRVGLAVAMVASVAAADSPSLQHGTASDGTRWLFGCVPTEMAARLVANGGFSYGGNPVANILCIEGYAPVSKQLGK